MGWGGEDGVERVGSKNRGQTAETMGVEGSDGWRVEGSELKYGTCYKLTTDLIDLNARNMLQANP